MALHVKAGKMAVTFVAKGAMREYKYIYHHNNGLGYIV